MTFQYTPHNEIYDGHFFLAVSESTALTLAEDYISAYLGLASTIFWASDHHLHEALRPYMRPQDLGPALSSLLGMPWMEVRDQIFVNRDRIDWLEETIFPLLYINTATVRDALRDFLHYTLPDIRDSIRRLTNQDTYFREETIPALRAQIDANFWDIRELWRFVYNQRDYNMQQRAIIIDMLNERFNALREMVDNVYARLNERVTREITVARMGLGAALSALASKIGSILKWLGITIGAVTLYDLIGLGIDEVMRIVWGEEDEITDEQAKILEDPPEPYDVHDRVIADLAKQIREKKGPYWDTIKRTTRAVLRPEIKLQPIW